MKEIEIKDQFKIDDSHSNIRGFVSVKEENGHIIFTKENMIVKSGRSVILNQMFGTAETKISFKLKLFISSEDGVTTPDMTLSDIKDKTEFELSNENKLEISIDEDELLIKIEKELTAESDGMTIQSAGLILNDNTLFSRVVFPKTSLKKGSTYTVIYYIYF